MVVSLPHSWCASASSNKHLKNLPLNKPAHNSKLVAALRKLRQEDWYSKVTASQSLSEFEPAWATVRLSEKEKKKERESFILFWGSQSYPKNKAWIVRILNVTEFLLYFSYCPIFLLEKNWIWASLGYSCNTVKAGHMECHAASGLVSLNQRGQGCFPIPWGPRSRARMCTAASLPCCESQATQKRFQETAPEKLRFVIIPGYTPDTYLEKILESSSTLLLLSYPVFWSFWSEY